MINPNETNNICKRAPGQPERCSGQPEQESQVMLNCCSRATYRVLPDRQQCAPSCLKRFLDQQGGSTRGARRNHGQPPAKSRKITTRISHNALQSRTQLEKMKYANVLLGNLKRAPGQPEQESQVMLSCAPGQTIACSRTDSNALQAVLKRVLEQQGGSTT